jgi:hypothetical protein
MNEVNISLTVDELNGVLAALGKLPLEAVIGLFSKIRAQAEAQLAQAQPQPEPQPQAE